MVNTVTVINLDGDDPEPGNDTATDADPELPGAIFQDGFEGAALFPLKDASAR